MKILNFGSLNLDYDYHLDHIAAPGETILADDLEICPGGKGLNQSIALAKAGAEVYHAGLIGREGIILKDLCDSIGINTDNIQVVEEKNGHAIIQVSSSGQNCIVLYGGANQVNSVEFVDSVLEQLGYGDVILLQNEMNQLAYMIDKAYEKGLKTVLNPSPYNELIEECDLSKVFLIIINEVEGSQMTGATEPQEILQTIHKLYPELEVVLTLGENGSVFMSKGEMICQKACHVSAVDTTAAGDTFTGYFLNTYLKESDAAKALEIASAASALSVTKKGAAPSIPCKEEVLSFMKNS